MARKKSSTLIELLVVGVVGFQATHAALAQLRSEKPQGQVAALEQQMDSLQLSNSAERIALWAEDLVYIGNDGAVHGKTSLARAVSAGEVNVEALLVTERKIRRYGDVAIVTAKEELRASFHGKAPTNRVERYTRVWAWRGSKWQVVSFEATDITETPPREAGFEACAADSARAAGSLEQEILRLEDEHAATGGDSAKGTGWLGEDYIGINGRGRLFDKPAVIELYSPGKLKYRYQNFSDRHVRFYGDVAIVTGIWCLRQLREGQNETIGANRFTRVWFKRNGKWEVVSWQGTPIPAKQEVRPGGKHSPS